MRDLVFNWGIHAFSGWGIVGLNIMGQFARNSEFRPLAAQAFDSGMLVGLDPYRYPIFQKIISDSAAWAYSDDCVWIDPVGNDLRCPSTLTPKLKIGRVICEKPDNPRAIENLGSYDKLLTGSTWNKAILEDATGREVKVIHEGIDPSLFSPGARSGWFEPEYFYIYSAGKVEYRKAQDVVLLAFKRFASRHPDARLVTCWNSPFGDIGNGYQGVCDAPLWLNEKGTLDIKRWAHDNGIDPDKVFDLGCFPNFVLPTILREMDVMLAPTRVESCTSLPVKEAMACGVPVIYGLHSGMMDLEDMGMPLIHQTPIRASNEYFFPSNDIEWYESDPEEIDEMLERAYNSRGLDTRSSNWVRQNRTWEIHARELKAWLSE